MIVAMDIGNTNIKAAVFEGSRLVKRWRCATDPAMTSDQYGIIMADLFRYHNLNMQAVEGIMISSRPSIIPSSICAGIISTLNRGCSCPA